MDRREAMVPEELGHFFFLYLWHILKGDSFRDMLLQTFKGVIKTMNKYNPS